MVYTIEKILRKYGTAMILIHDDKALSFKGFLQHSDSKSWQNMQPQYCALGKIPTGQYVLLAPMKPEIREDDTLLCGNLKVAVRRMETVMEGDRTLYRWGLCERTGGDGC